MFDLAPVTFCFFHAKKPKRKVPAAAEEAPSLRLWNYGGKKCRNPSETMWNIRGMFSLTVSGNDSGGMRGEAATFHPQCSAATNTKHAHNLFVLVLKSLVGAYLEGPWSNLTGAQVERYWLFNGTKKKIKMKMSRNSVRFSYFFCFLLLRLLPGAACLKREEGRNFRN